MVLRSQCRRLISPLRPHRSPRSANASESCLAHAVTSRPAVAYRPAGRLHFKPVGELSRKRHRTRCHLPRLRGGYIRDLTGSGATTNLPDRVGKLATQASRTGRDRNLRWAEARSPSGTGRPRGPVIRAERGSESQGSDRGSQYGSPACGPPIATPAQIRWWCAWEKTSRA